MIKVVHQGLKLSAAFLADKIGLKNYTIDFSRMPVIAKEPVKPKNREEIPAGYVAGLREKCQVFVNSHEKILLELELSAVAKKRNDVVINGNKNTVECNIHDDYSDIVNGDIATRLILKDAISKVIKGLPGLNSIDYVPNPHELLSS
ncbi:hypothetical protein JXB41_07190 [Candidatus Woesearchaeota archaeon]|nr:hypothetical protein [Candidatus Woesearchaeota archaeon]